MTPHSKRYSWIIIGVPMICIAVVLAFNLLMDPLWYLDGNRVRAENYSFDERLSKTNRFLKNEQQWDCVIFGSSRTTLLNETKLTNQRCFNYAFSGGRAMDFLAVADWLVARGFKPKRVIVGVDDFNYWESKRNNRASVPDFFITHREPPNVFQTYLTWDALNFSWRLLTQQALRPRYYDQNFIGTVIADPPRYEPEWVDTIPMQINPDSRHRYRALRDKFPDAKFIAYAPPLSPWELMKKTDAEMQHYLDANFEISRYAAAFYDYSIASALTRDPGNTYDGEHYSTAVNDIIVAAINGEAVEHGLRVEPLSRKEYETAFVEALVQFTLEESASSAQSNVDRYPP